MSTSANNNNNNEEENKARKGKGRQKVPMAKMENESNLQVTFSKRRSGLFKKASELSTRCGSETALVVFSPAGKPYSFGHPSVETVTSRFFAGNNPQLVPLEAQHQMIANETTQLNQTMDQIDVEKNHSKELDQVVKQMKGSKYLQQLDKLKGEVLDLKNKLGGNGQW